MFFWKIRIPVMTAASRTQMRAAMPIFSKVVTRGGLGMLRLGFFEASSRGFLLRSWDLVVGGGVGVELSGSLGSSSPRSSFLLEVGWVEGRTEVFGFSFFGFGFTRAFFRVGEIEDIGDFLGDSTVLIGVAGRGLGVGAEIFFDRRGWLFSLFFAGN